MARARNIKPGFFKNEDLAECSLAARLCFAGLWTLADREGRLEDRPKRIKAEIFAFDSIEVDPLLKELESRNFILRYDAGGLRAIQILKFLEHQTPHYSEKPSVIMAPNFQETPAPSTPPNSGSTPGNGGASRGGRNPLNPDSLNPDSLKGKKVASLPLDFVLPDWVPVDAWAGFVAMRKKKPMTDRARDLIVAKLSRFRDQGHDIGAILDKSTVSGWTDVFEPKEPAGRTPTMNGADRKPWEGAR